MITCSGIESFKCGSYFAYDTGSNYSFTYSSKLDSAQDQALKREIRDAIIARMQLGSSDPKRWDGRKRSGKSPLARI